LILIPFSQSWDFVYKPQDIREERRNHKIQGWRGEVDTWGSVTTIG
jgi:hypothetical protein